MLRLLSALVLVLLSLPASAADLVFVDLAMGDRLVEGASFTFSVTVRNDGGLAAAGDIGVTVRASSDYLYDTSDPMVCTRTLANGLAAGASTTVQVSCTWPSGITGSVWVVGRLDGPLLSEINYANNDGAKLVTVVPANAPDLVGELDAPTSVRAGETYGPHLRVDNDGATDAAPTSARLFLSSDTTWNGNDPRLCEVALPRIAAHDHVEVDFSSCTVPPGTAYSSGYLILFVDPTFTVSEVDEVDNWVTYPVSILPPLADLRFSSLTGPGTVLSGGTFAVDFGLVNDGYVDVAQAVVAVRASTDRVYDDTDPQVCVQAFAGPTAGHGVTGRLTGCVVPTSFGVGGRYLVARVDPGRTVAERDETNNDDSDAVLVTPRQPNLRIASFSPPGTASPGDTVRVDYTIENTGDADVTNTSLYVRFSADATYDASDTLMCGGAIQGAAQHASRSDTLTGCVVPASAPIALGYVVARVDANGSTAESDEGDNDAFAELDVVPPPDLRPDWWVTNVSPWGSVHIGWWLNADVTVKNQGLGDAPATSWTVYLSQDDVLDDGDRTLCSSSSVPALASKASTTMSGVGCELPARMRPGTWWAFVEIDPLDAVDEPDEANNVGGGPVEIVPITGDTAADTALDTEVPVDTDPGDTVVVDTVVDTGDTPVVDTDTLDTEVAETDDTDVVDTDTLDTEVVDDTVVPTETDGPGGKDDDDAVHAPPRWFCATAGGRPAALWTVGLLAAAAGRRRRRADRA